MRKQRLPCRIFVDRLGDDFKYVSGQELLCDKVALVLRHRAEVRQACRGRGVHRRCFDARRSALNTIWPREMQELVGEQLFGIQQREEGKHYAPLILTASPSGNTPAQLHKKL